MALRKHPVSLPLLLLMVVLMLAPADLANRHRANTGGETEEAEEESLARVMSTVHRFVQKDPGAAACFLMKTPPKRCFYVLKPPSKRTKVNDDDEWEVGAKMEEKCPVGEDCNSPRLVKHHIHPYSTNNSHFGKSLTSAVFPDKSSEERETAVGVGDGPFEGPLMGPKRFYNNW